MTPSEAQLGMTALRFLQIVYIRLTNARRRWSRMRMPSGSEGLIV